MQPSPGRVGAGTGGEMKTPLRQLAEVIITDLEQKSLPKTGRIEREDMVTSVHHLLRDGLDQRGYVRLVAIAEEEQ